VRWILLIFLCVPCYGATICEQRLTQDEIYARLTDNTEIRLTKQTIQAFYQTTNGNAASRRAQVIQWIKDQIAAAFGPSVIDSTRIEVDIDANQNPSLLRFLNQ